MDYRKAAATAYQSRKNQRSEGVPYKRGRMFNPKAKLDTSQVEDLRGKGPYAKTKRVPPIPKNNPKPSWAK